MAIRSFGILAALVLPLAGWAGSDWPPELLAGRYVLVGRPGPAAVDAVADDLWITVRDGALILESCQTGDGALVRGEGPDRIPFQRGRFAGADLGCEVFTDMGNYPVFACWDGQGGRLALFPDAERFGERPDCLDPQSR